MIPVLYEDTDLLAVDKPAGLLSVPGRKPELRDCVWTRLSEQVGQALGLVHRLDRDTSGLLLFAKTRETQARLGLAFERRRVTKQYIADVTGHVAETAGYLDLPLRKDWTRNDPPVYVVDPERGRSARTAWELLERREGFTRLCLRPETGRSHQLRVHMQAMGHPILGDPIYGRAVEGERMRLHAWQLRFRHPVTDQELCLTAPLPF